MIPNILPKFPKRFYVILLLFVGNTFYALMNTSIVIVDLTSEKKIQHPNGTVEIREAEYRWMSSQIGVILSMNAVGHFFSGFTGVIIGKLGGVTGLAICKTVEAIVSLTGPLVINTHVYLFMANRFVLGFIEGFGFISVMDVYVHWAQPDERVQLVNYAHLGYTVGSALALPTSGFIIQNFGWKYLFYICGTVTIIWNVVWIAFVSNDPSTDRFISEKERTYFSQKMNHISEDKIAIPYRKIFTSIPIYALMNEFFVSMFTSTFMGLLLPLYVKDMYNADVQTVGLISGIPELSAFIIRPIFAYIADHFRSKPDKYSIVWNNMIGCIACLTLARISFSISQISYNVILIDVCGQYAAFMQSIAVFFLSSAHFINPLVAGFIVPNHSQSEWNIYFIFISSLTMYGVIAFIFFGSGDLQPWAKVPDKQVTVNQTDEPATNKPS